MIEGTVHQRRLIRTATVASVAALLAATPPVVRASAAPPPYTVVSADSRRALACTLVNDREMVQLDELAALFELSVREDAAAGGVTVARRGRLAVLTPGQALASVGGRLVSLPAPVSRDGKRWFVPIEFVNRGIGPLLDLPIDLRRDSRLIVVGKLRVPRVVGRIDSFGSETRVTFDITPRTTHQVTQEAGRLLVRLDADYLDVAWPTAAGVGPVTGLRVIDPMGTIGIDLGPSFESYRASASTSEGPQSATHLVISVLASSPARALPQPTPPVELPIPVAPREPGLRVIAIDPGHGGEEAGAKGVAGTTEKDITLAVARRLKAALEARLGVRVVLTREADEAVSLDSRAELANNNRADLLVSVHANAAPRREVRGLEVFYLATDRAVAETRAPGTAPQDLPAFGGGRREIDVILWEMAQTRHLAQSAALATMIEEEVSSRLAMSARPVQQAPFRVLVGANMPAVLIEMGYLTNSEEEKLLASTEYQALIVQGLVDAIARFRAELERTR